MFKPNDLRISVEKVEKPAVALSTPNMLNAEIVTSRRETAQECEGAEEVDLRIDKCLSDVIPFDGRATGRFPSLVADKSSVGVSSFFRRQPTSVLGCAQSEN